MHSYLTFFSCGRFLSLRGALIITPFAYTGTLIAAVNKAFPSAPRFQALRTWICLLLHESKTSETTLLSDGLLVRSRVTETRYLRTGKLCAQEISERQRNRSRTTACGLCPRKLPCHLWPRHVALHSYWKPSLQGRHVKLSRPIFSCLH